MRTGEIIREECFIRLMDFFQWGWLWGDIQLERSSPDVLLPNNEQDGTIWQVKHKELHKLQQ
jgi:hypothetical protein